MPKVKPNKSSSEWNRECAQTRLIGAITNFEDAPHLVGSCFKGPQKVHYYAAEWTLKTACGKTVCTVVFPARRSILWGDERMRWSGCLEGLEGQVERFRLNRRDESQGRRQQCRKSQGVKVTERMEQATGYSRALSSSPNSNFHALFWWKSGFYTYDKSQLRPWSCFWGSWLGQTFNFHSWPNDLTFNMPLMVSLFKFFLEVWSKFFCKKTINTGAK